MNAAMRRLISLVTGALVIGLAPAAGAQSAPRPASARIIVSDATNLPIAGADVTLTAADGAIVKARTNDRGEATFDSLRPGTYKAHIESSGFEALEVAAFSIGAGRRVTREVELTIAAFVDELDVAPAADDQQLINSFTTELSDAQIAALPDDPDEIAQVLQQLVGADVEIRVDGFEGARLPPGAQIQEIRIKYDAGAASGGGGPRIEIRTQPGGDRWRNNAGMNVRDEALNARNAFAQVRPSGQTRQYSWNLNGPIVKGKTGISLSIDRSDSLENQAIRAAAPGGIFASLVEQPSSRVGIDGRLEHAISPSQTIRVGFRRHADTSRNQGVGEFDLPERGFSRESSDGELRLSDHATIRRRFVNDLRFQFSWSTNESVSTSDATTIRVLDAFTSGGAQIQGGRRWKEFEVEDELEFTLRKSHQIATGVSIDGTAYKGDEYRNAAGTYTFASLDAYLAGSPTTFTQRIGDPAFEYSMVRFSWHVQDNYRVRKNLMFNLGFRHDLQTHLRDWANLSPRAGVNWTPSPKAKTTLRASLGVSHNYFDSGLYQQTLLVNGLQQRDLVIANPGFPDPFSGGVAQAARPPSIIRARADLVMPFTRRVNLGVDQPFGKFTRLRVNYSRAIGRHMFRSRDVNAPVNGVRPDPAARNITELESTGRSLGHSLEVQLSANYQPKRFSANVNYQLGEQQNETDGAFTLPPDNFDLSGEWGPSRNDLRHRVNASLNSDLRSGFRINANVRAQSAGAYNITTGTDANADGVNNERPVGVGRNQGRGRGTKNFDLTLTWGLSIGQRHVDLPRGPARPQPGRRGPPNRNNDLFRFEIYARASNILNIVNPQNYSGVLTSPFFGLPTSAAAARRIVIGTRLWF